MNRLVWTAAVLLAVFALSGCGAQGQAGEPADPEAALRAFYDWYLEYAQSSGNPLVDRAYAESDYLTDSFVTNVDEILDSFERGGYDPILCAQDVPESVSISAVEVESDSATAQVSTSFGNSFQVQLARFDGVWLISDIICAP